MEATGSYWISLATRLVHEGFVVSVMNPAQAHHFAKALLKRAKTDAIDAQTLAQLAMILQPEPWTPPPQIYYALQQRLAQRDDLLNLRQQVRNQLHALVQHPEIIAEVRARMESLLATFEAQLTEVESEIMAALSQDSAWAAAATRLQSIKGVGWVTAAWTLVTTLNLTSCDTVDALTAYAGLAPMPRQSGSSVWHRPSIGHTGNGRLRTAFYMATLSAAQQFPLMTCEPYATIVADSSVRVSTSQYRLLQGLFRCEGTSCLAEGSIVSCWRRNCPPSWEIPWFDGTRSQQKWREITRNRAQPGGWPS
jgi:transposase